MVRQFLLLYDGPIDGVPDFGGQVLHILIGVVLHGAGPDHNLSVLFGEHGRFMMGGLYRLLVFIVRVTQINGSVAITDIGPVLVRVHKDNRAAHTHNGHIGSDRKRIGVPQLIKVIQYGSYASLPQIKVLYGLREINGNRGIFIYADDVFLGKDNFALRARSRSPVLICRSFKVTFPST
jgi:hypothetical protein